MSSIFKEKLIFDGEKYRTPIFNKGIEVLVSNIKALEVLKNKNERLSIDNLPFSTRKPTNIELFDARFQADYPAFKTRWNKHLEGFYSE